MQILSLSPVLCTRCGAMQSQDHRMHYADGCDNYDPYMMMPKSELRERQQPG